MLKLMNLRSFIQALILLMISSTAFTQAGPFALSPKWYFGTRAGIDFTSGSPVILTDGLVSGWGQEGSGVICDPSKNVVMYTNGYELYDGAHIFKQNIRGGTSSTQNSVIVPDPANPSSRYYLFTANVDPSGGGQRDPDNSVLGINYYHIEKSGATINVIGGPVQLATYNQVTEQLCSGTDDNGNYWVVAHQGGDFSGWNMREIYSWPVTASGVGAKVTSSIAGTTGNNVWQGSMKINKCQTRLAAVYASNPSGSVEIYEWDASTGTVTSLIQRVTGLQFLYGCEFSPDGNIVYATSHSGDVLYQIDVATGATFTDPGWKSVNNTAWMGTLQLGPDDKIYVTNGNNPGGAGGAPAYIGVVNDPNVFGAGCNYDGYGLLLNAGPAIMPNIERGIANVAWLAPACSIAPIDLCPDFSFSYSFKNYFNEAIPVVAGSEEWDFADGSGFQLGFGSGPNHSYTSSGVKTVKLKFRDQACNRTWNVSQDINVGCVLPLIITTMQAEKIGKKVKVSWTAGSESETGTGTKYFIIERSDNGESFDSIGIMMSSSLNGAFDTYEFYDGDPTAGQSYYRIKQIDWDNTYFYSAVASVSHDESEFTVYPNPSESNFELMLNEVDGAQIIVYDALGKEVYSEEYRQGVKFGSDFSSGPYIVRIVKENLNITQKIIKK